jgi:hypothetical protein
LSPNTIWIITSNRVILKEQARIGNARNSYKRLVKEHEGKKPVIGSTRRRKNHKKMIVNKYDFRMLVRVIGPKIGSCGELF